MKQPDKEKHSEKPDAAVSEKSAGKPAEKSTGIVQPMIDELRQHPKDATISLGAPPPGPIRPPQPDDEQPAELDQDAGGGYNPDGTYPQT